MKDISLIFSILIGSIIFISGCTSQEVEQKQQSKPTEIEMPNLKEESIIGSNQKYLCSHNYNRSEFDLTLTNVNTIQDGFEFTFHNLRNKSMYFDAASIIIFRRQNGSDVFDDNSGSNWSAKFIVKDRQIECIQNSGQGRFGSCSSNHTYYIKSSTEFKLLFLGIENIEKISKFRLLLQYFADEPSKTFIGPTGDILGWRQGYGYEAECYKASA